MGSVFLARDPSLGREVALKVAKGDDPTRRARFLDEMRILGQLEHPNVVPLHALVVSDRAPFCTMRYVRGRTLAEVLGALRAGDPETTARYSITRLVQVLLQVTQAIDFAHSRGVLHRDLKPANVMLGEHGEVQVLDWGLAKVIDRGDGKVLASGTDHTRVGRDRRDARVHVPRAGLLLAGGRAVRRLGAGRDDVRDAHARAAVLGREPDRDARGGPARRPEAAARAGAAPRDSRRARAHVPQGARKSPDARHASVRELQDEIQAWLEAEADKVKRQESAGKLARRAARSSRTTGRRRRRSRRSSARSRALRGSLPALAARAGEGAALTRPRTGCATRARSSRARARTSS